MSDPAIQIEHLHKRYRLGATVGLSRLLRRPQTLDALHDVHFDVAHGEAVGIIGRNGAGKSTLLKVLSQITPPTSGRVTIHGRVASLLEVGTGFHPELSGLENIYLNGAILGMKRREIRAKLDEIIDFSGVGDFLDTPVKRYSSGMRVRLAFAVAAHLEPEVLVVDEVLAVGDAAFQQKCLGKMRDVAGGGRTVLFVSHNTTAVQNLCDRALWLEQGRQRCLGPSDEVMAAYQNDVLGGQAEAGRLQSRPHPGVIRTIEVRDAERQLTPSVASGGAVTFTIQYRHGQPLHAPCFGIGIDDEDGRRLAFLQTRLQHGPIDTLPAAGTVECTVPRLMLAPGRYTLSVGCSAEYRQLDQLERAVVMEVTPWDVYRTGRLPQPHQGRALMDAAWSLSGNDTARKQPAALRRAG